MAACSLFDEDVVYAYKKGKGYSFGLVLENSELLSSSDEEETEYNEDRVKKGFVRIAWYPTGRESVVAENKVKLADRSLMPGDVVRRFIPGQQTQSGFIVDMDVRCHLHIKRTNKYIYNVNSKDLEPLQKFESGQDVVLDMWLGKVVYVNTFVILVFTDGARCHADESDIADYDDVSEKKERRGEFSAGLFYEGQVLRGPLDNLASVEWLHSTPRFSAKTAKKKGDINVTVTVEKVVTGSVDVQWVFKRFEDPDAEVTTPDTVVQGEQLKKLKVLDWFDYCSVVIADRKMYRIKNDDYLRTVVPSQVFDPACLTDREYGVPALASCNAMPSQPTSNQASNLDAIKEQDIEIEVCEDDSDDDEEEKEDEEKTGDSVAKACGGSVSSKKKKRGSYKAAGMKCKPAKQSQRGAASNKRKNSTKERVVTADSLVEVEVEFTNSWAKVMWQDGSVECDIPSCELFPVHHLDELEFFPGDFILPQVDMDIEPDYGVVVRCNHTERTCIIDWFNAFDGVKEKEPQVLQRNAEVSVYDIKDHPVFKFRPGQTVVLITAVGTNNPRHTSLQSVGQILEFDPRGQLVIKWSDGTIGLCHPQEVYMVSEEDEEDESDDDSWDGDSNSDCSSDTWETESESEIIGEEIENKDEEKASTDAINEQKQELNSLLSRAQSALVRLQTLLNSFDVSISAPECFHDIIRIYRSCHDVDKILRSSFFSDPELQNLIAQAKREVKRDKANKISQHLNQLLESWGKSSSDSNTDAMNIRIGTFSGNTLHFAVKGRNKNDEGGLSVEENEKDRSDEASGGVCDMRTDDSGVESFSGNVSDEVRNCRALRKEYSEPLISNMHKEDIASTQHRRPSDPALKSGVETSRQVNGNVNMVGENCVGKATKRPKSDSLDYAEHDPKKSREETTYVNHTAQELCFKICENLQRQLLKIHEEVDKRTSRLMSNEEKKAICGDTSSVNVIEEGTVSDVNHESFNADTPTLDLQNKEESEKSEEVLKEPDTPSTDSMQPDISLTGAAVDAEKDDLSLSDDTSIPDEPSKGFCLNEEVGTFHKFSSQQYQPSNPRAFNVAVRKELHLLRSSLPDGIFVNGFENRLDLYSVMILGPAGTPYEDAVFLFDFMLPKDYPSSPPLCHYHSFCNDRLNPNLYEDGKVCVSLLGTWSGKGSEMWTSKSNMLQVFLSIQGLILVREPYYNEAGYERQRGTQVGEENSRMYNEMAVLKSVQSLTKMCHKLPTAFENDIRTHLLKYGSRIIKRLRKWVEMAQSVKNPEESSDDIEFPKSSPADGAEGMVSNASIESQVTDKLHHLQMNGKISPENESIVKESSAPTSPPCLAEVTDNCDKDVDCGGQASPTSSKCQGPDFPLFPISRGFCLALSKALESFDNALKVLHDTSTSNNLAH